MLDTRWRRDFPEVFYYVRNPDPANVLSIFERVAKAAEGAAMGTGRTVDYEIIHGLYALLPNETLARAVHANLEQVGGVQEEHERRRGPDFHYVPLLGDRAPPLDYRNRP